MIMIVITLMLLTSMVASTMGSKQIVDFESVQVEPLRSNSVFLLFISVHFSHPYLYLYLYLNLFISVFQPQAVRVL